MAVSDRLERPMLACESLARGRLLCIVPERRAPARPAAKIVRYPLSARRIGHRRG